MDLMKEIAVCREILGIISRDPSVSKSNRLHVDIIQFFFVKMGYTL